MDAFRAFRSRSRVYAIALVFALALLMARDARSLDPGRAITQYIQNAWNSEAGLPQNSVHAVTQTRDGFLWMGTEEGLARFDGVQFKVYNTQNAPGLPSNFIQSLSASRDGSLWVGTESGLSHFAVAASAGTSRASLAQAGVVATLTRKDALAGDNIAALYQDADGTLWVGTTTGLSLLRGGRVESGPPELAGVAIQAIASDARGRVWIGSEKGLFEFDHGQWVNWGLKAGVRDRILSLAPDRDGSLWFGSARGGLLHLVNGRVASSPAIGWDDIETLLIDRDGALWMTFERHGIARLYRGRLSFYTREQGLPSSRVLRALFEDREGNLWIGLLDAGIVQLREGRFAVFGTREGLAGNYVGNILQARDGTMWIASDSNGLNHLFPDGTVEVWNHSRGLPNQPIYSLCETRNGDLWVGFRIGALAQIRNGHLRVYRDPRNPKVSLNTIYEDRDGNLWVSLFGKGLAQFKDGRFQHVIPMGRVDAIAQTPDGALWVATDGDGVERFFHGVRRRFGTADGLPSNHVMSLYADAEGDVWIGTASGGLSWIHDGKVVSWTPARGLPEPTVGSIVEDNHGALWIGGDGGIYSLSKQVLKQTNKVRILAGRLYGTSDGLRSRETLYGSMPSAWKDRSGRLWFATIAGAAIVDPERIKASPGTPPVWIESVSFDSQPVALEQGVRLGPGANNLEIAFISPTFTAPQFVQFRYRLVGFDRDWIDAGTRRRAWYTNLAPGEYTFTVQAKNSDGVWSSAADSFGFVLLPPWTRTPLAYALYGVLIVFAGWGMVTLRTRTLLRRQQELARTVAERTAQLEEEKRALEAARQELHMRATHDSLTGLFNRAAMIEHLQREVHRARRDGTSLGVVILDLDHFKQVNDRFGHLCGDDIIHDAGERLLTAMRKSDVVGRYGGEEFLILVPAWNPAMAPARVDHLVDSIRGRTFRTGEHEIALTCSIGACTYRPEKDSPELRDILSRADAALYAAKEQGRNRACLDSSVTELAHLSKAAE
jgi:diguanylate cyclase (GGDEF)-like protein